MNLGYDYYPLNTNKRVYQVSEINFNLLGPDTASYQLRESISDTIQHEEDISYVLKREKRADENAQWEKDSLWVVRKNDFMVSVTENNQTYVKLSFPVVIDRQWDGNAYNTESDRLYTYIETDTSQLLTTFIDSSMVTVQIAAVPDNLSFRDERFEVYAEGLGLIEKNYIRVTYCTVGCDSVKQIQSGSILNQYMIGYEE